MKSLRERFEEEYAAVRIPADNKNGFTVKYVYYAPWYVWDLPKDRLKSKKNTLVGLSVVSALLYLFAGLQYTGLNSDPAVTLAAVLALCAHILELLGVFQFLFARYRTTRMTYMSVNQILRAAPAFRGGALAVVAVSGVFYMVRNTFDIRGITAMVAYTASAAIAFYIYREYRRIPFLTEKNNSLENHQELL